MVEAPLKKIGQAQQVKLVGFNNLTKSLSFNLYDFCVARNESERNSYMQYIGKRFNAAKVTGVLRGICDIIEAKVLAVSDQDYEPWGASSLILMSDLKGGGTIPPATDEGSSESTKGPLGQHAVHLDKSHLCAHTYPDFHNGGRICSFRIDIHISTCGEISPLNALNYMFQNFEADVVVIDYVVRGFTRDASGRRIYMDHQVRSIQDYIQPEIMGDYHCIDLALQSENIWQTKMLRIRQDTPSYFRDPVVANDVEVMRYMDMINREMRGVLHMWPE